MPDISPVAAGVRAKNGAKVRLGTAKVTITPGQSLYLDGTVNKLDLADADGTTGSLAKSTCVGVSCSYADAEGVVAYVEEGPIDLGGAILTQSAAYGVSPAVAGNIAPTTDAGTTNDWISAIGVALTTSVLYVKPANTGSQVP